MSRARVGGFAALVVVCVAIGAGYLAYANDRSADEERSAPKVDVAGPGAVARFEADPHVVFRSTGLGETYGRVALVRLDDTRGQRAVTELSCERVDFAADRGVCLQADRGAFTTYRGVVVDSRFRELRTFDLLGLPSRTRVSPNGRWAGMTVFVTGDSYASSSFSTRTTLLDLRSGEMLPDLEQWEVTNDGEVVTAIDRNYWGVTFTPNSREFYATLQYGGNIYLIKGDIASRTAKVVRDDVECPSLSPDGTRIAYKLRTGGQLEALRWRVHVLDLATGESVATAETRSVDDQVEWLDDDTLVYGLPTSEAGGAVTNTWTVPADGSGRPQLLVPRAWSPSVVRDPA